MLVRIGSSAITEACMFFIEYISDETRISFLQ